MNLYFNHYRLSKIIRFSAVKYCRRPTETAHDAAHFDTYIHFEVLAYKNRAELTASEH